MESAGKEHPDAMRSDTSREIHAVLSTLPFDDRDLDQLRRAFAPAEFIQKHFLDNEGIVAALQHVDVAVVPFDIDQRFLDAPNLRWVHCDHAGLNGSARPEVFAKGLIVTGSAGRSAPALAQHAFYFALALAYRARSLFEQQSKHQWGGIPGYENTRALFGGTLGIVGFGHTGQEVAALGSAFGMRTIVYSRSRPAQSDGVDVMLAADAGDTIAQLLSESDVIVLAAGLNDETYRMFSTPQFEAMKNTSFLINIGRGGLVDHDALAAALANGEIAGAGLDVTDPEPLPADSPLWDISNVVITPHTTPRVEDRTQRSLDVILDNISRYRAGEPMRNALTERDLFTRRQHGRQ